MSDLTFDLAHGKNNARNSEGAFLRTASGRIRFVYSRYTIGAEHQVALGSIATCGPHRIHETLSQPVDSLKSKCIFRATPNVIFVDDFPPGFENKALASWQTLANLG